MHVFIKNRSRGSKMQLYAAVFCKSVVINSVAWRTELAAIVMKD